jgi:hypothetical protein
MFQVEGAQVFLQSLPERAEAGLRFVVLLDEIMRGKLRFFKRSRFEASANRWV